MPRDWLTAGERLCWEMGMYFGLLLGDVQAAKQHPERAWLDYMSGDVARRLAHLAFTLEPGLREPAQDKAA